MSATYTDDFDIAFPGPPGESQADILRRTGQFGVLPSDTDAQVMSKLNGVVEGSTARVAVLSTLAAGFNTYAETLAFLPSMADGDVTTVAITDTGTHGALVPNAGRYQRQAGALVRLGNTGEQSAAASAASIAGSSADIAKLLARQALLTKYGNPYWVQLFGGCQDVSAAGLYDPTNPNTRATRTDDMGDVFATSIADAMGKLPPLLQATEIRQSRLIDGYFGGFSALYRDINADAAVHMATAGFNSGSGGIANVPFAVVLLSAYEAGIPSSSTVTRSIFDGVVSSSASFRRDLYVLANGTGYSTKSVTGSTTTIASETASLDRRGRTMSIISDTSGVSLRRDGVQIASSIAAGSGLSSLMVLNNANLDRPWLGGIGPFVLLTGADLLARVQVIEALLMGGNKRSNYSSIVVGN